MCPKFANLGLDKAMPWGLFPDSAQGHLGTVTSLPQLPEKKNTVVIPAGLGDQSHSHTVPIRVCH